MDEEGLHLGLSTVYREPRVTGKGTGVGMIGDKEAGYQVATIDHRGGTKTLGTNPARMVMLGAPDRGNYGCFSSFIFLCYFLCKM